VISVVLWRRIPIVGGSVLKKLMVDGVVVGMHILLTILQRAHL
jgi:hypothetical protein